MTRFGLSHARPRRPATQGFAVLGATLTLVVVMSLTAAYVSRALIFGQRSASNQTRASRAFHTAEAGLDWALAMLNDPRPIDDACQPQPAGTSFRQRYLNPSAGDNFAPTPSPGSQYAPSCRIGAGILECRCPTPGIGPTPSTSGAVKHDDDTRLAIGFEPVAGDMQSVMVTAHGCTDLDSDCPATEIARGSQATARVVAVMKLRRALAAQASAPAAAAASANGTMTIVPGSWHDQ